MVKVGDKIFYPIYTKIRFFGKKGVGGKTPKISQKLNQLGFGSNFQGKLKPTNDQSWWQKFLPHLNQNLILWQKRGWVETPQNKPKSQQTRIWLKFSGWPQASKDCDLRWKSYPNPSQPKFDFRHKKRGGGHSKSGRNKTNSDLAQTFRVTLGQ